MVSRVVMFASGYVQIKKNRDLEEFSYISTNVNIHYGFPI